MGLSKSRQWLSGASRASLESVFAGVNWVVTSLVCSALAGFMEIQVAMCYALSPAQARALLSFKSAQACLSQRHIDWPAANNAITGATAKLPHRQFFPAIKEKTETCRLGCPRFSRAASLCRDGCWGARSLATRTCALGSCRLLCLFRPSSSPQITKTFGRRHAGAAYLDAGPDTAS